MVALKLAFRNLVGAGLRTWLNVTVLSISYVVIIWNQATLQGWDEQARRDTIAWEIGGGQYWQENYDPFDPLALENSHALPPPELQDRIKEQQFTPVLAVPASMYPQGRMQSVVLKGIDPRQTILAIPSSALSTDIPEIPAVIGTRMAKSNKLHSGDLLTIRWRDAHGTFDATEVKIVAIMRTTVASVDQGQIWLPLERLRSMTQLAGQASFLVAQRDNSPAITYPGWVSKNQETLLEPIAAVIKAKSFGAAIIFTLLLLLAMLAIFDTQVLAIFRRRKEIGTLMALGMTRGRVIRIFTFEGAMHAVLAAGLAALYGIPLLYYYAKTGFKMPAMADEMGITIADTLFPKFTLQLIAGTIALVLVAVTVVSYLPTRKIAKMNPTDAIRGKLP
jgi:ABC-type lipoprotein release transport system permease subunit